MRRAFLSLALLPFLSFAEEVRTIPIFVDAIEEAPAAKSEGATLKETGFDASAEIKDFKNRSGVVFQSYRPGSIWHGARPEFVAPEIEIGGEEVLPCTDVYEDGRFLYAHYGTDHYQTRAVSVIDANRRELLRLTAFSLEDISRLAFVPESGTVYFTTLEGNLDGKEKARLHAFSVAAERALWTSEAGVAHGDFLLFGKHLMTKYGFTGEDDFVFLIDRGNGKTVAKHRLTTAASALLRVGDSPAVTVPCYTGVVSLSVEEE
ncbi:MAG: hypothetical protein AAGC68_16725 [Verrucomicrobiota bacterium]